MMRRLSLGVALCFSTALGCGDDTGSGGNTTPDAGPDGGSTTSTGGSSSTGKGSSTGSGSTNSNATGSGATSSTAPGDGGGAGDAGPFTILSPDFEDGDPLPEENTCEGKEFGAGYSPELVWSGAPEGTKRYALVFKDLTIEALGGDLLPRAFHWVAWDIPTSVTGIPQHLGIGDSPAALEGGKQFRAGPPHDNEFFGPCPSWIAYQCPGEPRANDEYAFVLYAFDDEDLDYPDAEGDPAYAVTLNAFLKANAIAETVLEATSNAKPTTSPVPDFVCPGVGLDAGADGGDAAADGGESTLDGGDAAADGGDSTSDAGDSTADSGDAAVDGNDAASDASADASDGG